MSDPLQRLFEGFQGRDVRRDEERAVSMPEELFRVSRVLNTVYRSDKRDPGDPFGEGRQGVWKLFTHEHGPGVFLYATRGWGGPVTSVSLRPRWPRAVAWLGQLVELEFPSGTVEFKSVDLWVGDDHRTILGLPRRKSSAPRPVLLLRGGRMVVEERGIVK